MLRQRIALLYLSLLATSATGGNTVDTLLSTDPVTEAERAFASGDRRHIVVPVCGSQPGEVIPGWPLEESSQTSDAMEKGRRPISCNDLGDDPKSRTFMRVARYAEQYNRTLLKLEVSAK